MTWNLRRCGGALMITDVKFMEPLYPSPSTWIEVKDNGHTIDGNLVKVVATVVNTSGQTKSGYINFKELKENTDLPEGKIQIAMQPGRGTRDRIRVGHERIRVESRGCLEPAGDPPPD